MFDRALRALGIDAAQWRTLVAAYLRMDMRTGGGAIGRRIGVHRSGRHPMTGPAVFMGLGGAVFAAIAIGLHDPLVAATLLTSYGAINTAMLLLVEFNSVVLSPDDYGVLGHRPVDSRTYFAARLSAVLAYTSLLGAALALLPALVFAFWRQLGVLSLATTVAAVVLCNAVVTVFVVVGEGF